MRQLTNDMRILRALSRFDFATVEDVATAVGAETPDQRRKVWGALQRLVADGRATRDGGRKCVALYRVTDAGRAQRVEARAA